MEKPTKGTFLFNFYENIEFYSKDVREELL